MGGSGVQMITGNAENAARELFALTDEQILEMDEGGGDASGLGEAEIEEGSLTAAAKGAASVRDDNAGNAGRQDAGATRANADGKSAARDRAQDGSSRAQSGVTVAQEPPGWLAERMKDPWHGDEAKELWAGKQKAEKEAAAYREVFATAEDARALKEIYPGGVNEARSAAERARQLDEIDGMFFRGDGAARTQLAQKMMEQDPAAFREMVAAGVRLLGAGASEEEKSRSLAGARDDRVGLRADNAGRQDAGATVADGNAAAKEGTPRAQSGVTVPPEVARAYGEFERATNAELEKSIGGRIARTIEQALPNLRQMGGRDGNGVAPLQERLTGAVKEEVDAALKSDGQLGEQVAKILTGRRFDDAARAQVVRLIDARAQQLVPGAVKRVVGSWTQATFAARRGNGREENNADDRGDDKAIAARAGSERPVAGRNEKSGEVRQESGRGRSRRVDYGKLSDEEILEL